MFLFDCSILSIDVKFWFKSWIYITLKRRKERFSVMRMRSFFMEKLQY